ncbi:TIGR02642 family protein [Vibrio navarrensis]|uniref:TIGR02642 family protein n=1 Tax=Vibrio navarrensis TaxID=29495 RepID=UPI00186A220B|nr:TIGR02642 family protein [Vibrio navarrensis]MBE4617361.1 hypothetical protein [Vibrio navarrensis]
MNQAVEMLAKLHAPKAMIVESKVGRRRLTPDVILAAFSAELLHHPVGRTIIEARYLGDEAARLTFIDHVRATVAQEKVNHVSAVADIVANLVLQVPLRSQRVKLRSLYKKYDARSKRSLKLIETWKLRIKSMEKSGNLSMQPLIEKHQQDIELEKARLHEHAQMKAGESLNCPKCHGSGNYLLRLCNECGGVGMLRPTREQIYAEFRQLGVRITEEDFARTFLPVITELVSGYCRQEIIAADALEKRLRLEKFGVFGV